MKAQRFPSAPVLFLMLLLIVPPMQAANVRFVPITVVQPDGRIIHCYLSGDEYYHWLHDQEGYTILRNEATGYYVWAEKRGEELVPTDYVVGEVNPRTLGIEKWLTLSPQRIQQRRALAKRLARLDVLHGSSPSKGTLHNLVIFVRFQDQDEFQEPLSKYEEIFNDSSQTAFSVYNYFKESSYNQLILQSSFYPISKSGFVVSYQDSFPRDYYTRSFEGNPEGYTDVEAAKRERALVRRAIEAVRDQIPADLNIDADNDGYVDQVCIIVRGPQTEWASLLWPHAFGFPDEMNVTIHGKRVRTYTFIIQEFASIGVHTAIIAHEILHTMGAPDLYHYSHDGLIPVGEWDIMSYAWPEAPHMGAYMKYKYTGWIDKILEITQPGKYTLNPLIQPTNNCYRIASPYSSSQFFVVEYRKQEGLFETHGMMGSGLLVYRIDTTNGLRGNASGPPDEVYIYRPGGTVDHNGNQWEAYFSADVGRTAINDATDPNSFLQDGSPGGLNIFNIDSAGETIDFEVSFEPVAFVSFQSPRPYSSFRAGDTYELSWRSGKVGAVKLEYSIDNGRTWKLIASSIVSDHYAWTVPNTPSHRALLRISDPLHPGTHDLLPFYLVPAQFHPLVWNEDISKVGCNFSGGITMLDDQLWVALWNKNKITILNPKDLSYVDSFSLAGISGGIAAMTWDRQQSIYAIEYAQTTTLLKIDVPTRKIADSLVIHDPQFPAIGILCFDPTADGGKGGLWISTPGLIQIGLYNLAGKKIDSLNIYQHGFGSIRGMAFDSDSPGGPYLWLFDRGAGPGYPQLLYKLHIASNTVSEVFRDVTFDVGEDPQNTAADLFCFDRITGGTVLLGGVVSGRLDNRLFAYDIAAPVTAVDQKSSGLLPTRFALWQNFPNPFNPATRIRFRVPERSRVEIKVFNLLGQEIKTLVRGTYHPGSYDVIWDGTNQRGRPVGSGIYLFTMKAGNFSAVRKGFLLR